MPIICWKLFPYDKRNTLVWSWTARETWVLFWSRLKLCFVSEYYWKHHVSSPVMTLLNITALFKRSNETWRWRYFRSFIKIRGIIFEVIFLFLRLSARICSTASLYLFTSAIIRTHTLPSEYCFVLTVSRFIFFSPCFCCFASFVHHRTHLLALPWTTCTTQNIRFI